MLCALPAAWARASQVARGAALVELVRFAISAHIALVITQLQTTEMQGDVRVVAQLCSQAGKTTGLCGLRVLSHTLQGIF